MSKEYLKDLTVFIISVEQKENYKACKKAILNQSVDFSIKEVKNVCPMSMAFNSMLDQCDTKYFIQLDEDMILDHGAVEHMYNSIKKSDKNTATVMFKLHDHHLNELVYGVRISKADIIKKYPFQNTLASENNQKWRIREDGYNIKRETKSLGVHSPYWTNEAIFQRYYNFGERYKQLNGHKEIFSKLKNIMQKDPSDLNVLAFLGAFSAIFSNKEHNEEKDYRKYKKDHFEKVCEVLND